MDKDRIIDEIGELKLKLAMTQNLINEKNFKSIEYGNKNQDIIQFQQSIGDWHMNVDTEDANKVEKISIQGHEGLLVKKTGLLPWFGATSRTFLR